MRLRSIINYPNVVATLALVIASSGGAYAVSTSLAKNSVGTSQLRAGAVTAAKLHANAVGGGKVLDHSLSAADLVSGAFPSGAILQGTESFVANCDNVRLIDKTIKVLRPSTVFVTSTGSWGSNGSGAHSGEAQAQIFKGTQQLGFTAGPSLTSPATSDLEAYGIAGFVANQKTGAPLVLSPGTYPVRLLFTTFGGCTGSSFAYSPTMSYLLVPTGS
ncbi:MAG: hypothetical protein JWP74_4207 [Marmoricola sp.]|nr:hypothetical protein [Marmoricola sp.]